MLKSCTMKSVKEVKWEIKERLGSIYTENEINSLSKQLFSSILKFSATEYLLNDDLLVADEDVERVVVAVNRLQNSEPIQYVVGSCEFYGLSLEVDKSVLIPRPETEELIEWIRSKVASPTSIVDICTGSGCIALALKSIYSMASVEGWDISKEALNVASRNSVITSLPVLFKAIDVLNDILTLENVDLIVSNPPYVRDSEKSLMADNVLKYEPHLALFVEDSDPLIFYNRIAQIAKEGLAKGGFLFFEINEAFGNEVVALLVQLGFVDVELKRDMSGRERMVAGRKP